MNRIEVFEYVTFLCLLCEIQCKTQVFALFSDFKLANYSLPSFPQLYFHCIALFVVIKT